MQGSGARVYGVRCRVQNAGKQGWVVPIWPSSLSARAKYDGTRISWHEGLGLQVWGLGLRVESARVEGARIEGARVAG